MLEMDATSQLAMAPYVVMVEVAFKSNAWIAIFRKAVLVKVPGGCEGGEGGEGGGGGEGGEGGDDGGGEGGDGGGGGGSENFSCKYFTVSTPPLEVYPWFVSVRTLRYLLGAVGVHSVVVPSSGNVGVTPLCQVL